MNWQATTHFLSWFGLIAAMVCAVFSGSGAITYFWHEGATKPAWICTGMTVAGVLVFALCLGLVPA